MRTGFLFSVVLMVCSAAWARPASEQDKNKEVARTFFEEVLGQNHLEKYAESHSKDFVAHGKTQDASLEEDMAYAKEERQALPDMKIRVNQILAERDLVAVYWTAWGTNTQAGMGFPATGKKISVDGMTIFRFKAGKICEEWGVWSLLDAKQQAGILCPQQ